uniref:Uncharacterized protein n=2 Tax=Photinus pyralis TaxID=7054 RepID=A0A1Y1LE08_PHOPY
MPEVLYLSHWDAAMPVVVPNSVVKILTNYQILAIRFLYNCLQKGYRGAILNEETEMNPCIQVSAFLNALNSSISIEAPAIVLCTAHTFGIWHYHLSNYAGNGVTVLSERNCEQILQSKSLEIILSTVDNLKWLKGAELDFFTVIIDDLDVVINKKFVKQIKGQYHIGITTRNFLKDPGQKLFRNMLLWANPGCVGKLEEFCEEDDEHLNQNRYAYGEYWLRLTWSFCETFKKSSKDDLEHNQAVVNNWLYENDVSYSSEEVPKRRVRKRKRESVTKEVSNCELKDDVKDVTPPPPQLNESTQVPVNSQETIIYDYTDDCPLLTSIINNDHVAPASKPEDTGNAAVSNEPKTVRTGSSEDLLLSIMSDDFNYDGVREEYSHNHSSSKDNVLSMLFSDSE